MASLAKNTAGSWRVIFYGADGLRREVTVGKLPKRQAEGVQSHIENLLSAGRLGGEVSNATSAWVQSLGDTMHKRLAAAGLIPERLTARLGEFLDQYIEKRTDVGERTRENYRQSRRCLLEFFAEDRRMDSITPEEAIDYRRWLQSPDGAGLAEATASRRCGRARQFFKSALRSRLIQTNPFAEVKLGSQENRDRQFFIDRESIAKIIAACPNARWRLIFALARFGGLRCPSELAALRWSGICWEADRFTVYSPKTERTGKASRVVPIFPELRPHLDVAWGLANEGEDRVIPDIDGSSNLRTTAEKILVSAGVVQWPRLFQNLRSSRETELAEEYPIQVVTSWLGNSPEVARKHYLQVTDEHFKRASAESVEKLPTNQPTSMQAIPCTGMQIRDTSGNVNHRKPFVCSGLQDVASVCPGNQSTHSTQSSPPPGLEPGPRD